MINMEFSIFFDIMWTYLANPEVNENNTTGRPQFLRHLIDLLIRTPQTDLEDIKDENGELNPLNNIQDATINKYCSGIRPIPKKYAKGILKIISDGKKFTEEIDFATPVAKENILKKLRVQQFDATSSSLGEMCFEIMKAFLEKFKEGKTSVTQSDIGTDEEKINCFSLLQEVNSICPLCSQKLLNSSNTNTIAGYDIVNIFPNNLDMEDMSKFSKIKPAPENKDNLENKIPLCLNCANTYLRCPVLDKYKRLVEIKDHINKENKINVALNQLVLESQLTEVIKGLSELTPNQKASSLQYDAHKIEEKIGNDLILRDSVITYVTCYYNKIKEQFSNLTSKGFVFRDLAATIRLAYVKLNREGLSQSEIFNRIAKWIIKEENLSEHYFEAARAIVAYFVQDCEVFEVENS